MADKFKWAIEDIYPSVEAWNKDYENVEGKIDFSEFKGKLGNADEFLACMKKQEALGRVVEKLAVYATMLLDINTADSSADALVGKITSLSVKFSAETAYVTPELTSLSESVLNSYIENPKLAEYDYMLKGLIKEKKHILSENEETLLALSGETLSSFREIFTKIDNADLPLKAVRHNGKSIPLSHGAYGVILHSEDRELRRKGFKSYYNSYKSLINTITATYSGNVRKDVFVAKAKKYDGALDMALCSEDVGRKVYDNLITSVNSALPTLHEYMEEKKKILGYDKMHMYDVYVPVTENAELKLEYPEAYKLVIEGLAPLGKEYQELLQRAYDERWLDVYETKNKRSGAYSVAVYDTHPFVLLNYQKTTSGVFTIAHEMGHSIHSYFSNRTQPYAKADYKIFVAEVASTVNEVLLLKHLLKTAEDKKLKKYLLSYLMEMIRTTLFRQAMFSEFEEYSHASLENGEPLTKDGMCAKYAELNEKYYGNAIEKGSDIKYEWARIPHFYRAFYVYKYATGIISALAIADRILTEGQSAVDDYFAFLSSGGSDSPVELLKIAGVDLNEIKPFDSAFKAFRDCLDEFKSL